MQMYRATTDEDLIRCYPVIHELRPHLAQDDFVSQVKRQAANHGYQLVYIAVDENAVACAGYRVAEFLAWGRALYIDDLITRESLRGKGLGGRLLDWLVDQAKQLECDSVHLDSGVQRHAAHRLYMNRKLAISSHHFSMCLG